MNRIILGLVAISLAIWGLVVWWPTFGMVMRGVMPFCLLMFGLVNIASGLRRFGHKEKGDTA